MQKRCQTFNALKNIEVFVIHWGLSKDASMNGRTTTTLGAFQRIKFGGVCGHPGRIDLMVENPHVQHKKKPGRNRAIFFEVLCSGD